MSRVKTGFRLTPLRSLRRVASVVALAVALSSPFPAFASLNGGHNPPHETAVPPVQSHHGHAGLAHTSHADQVHQIAVTGESVPLSEHLSFRCYDCALCAAVEVMLHLPQLPKMDWRAPASGSASAESFRAPPADPPPRFIA